MAACWARACWVLRKKGTVYEVFETYVGGRDFGDADVGAGAGDVCVFAGAGGRSGEVEGGRQIFGGVAAGGAGCQFKIGGGVEEMGCEDVFAVGLFGQDDRRKNGTGPGCDEGVADDDWRGDVYGVGA